MGFEIAARIEATIDQGHVKVRPFDGYIFLCGGALEASQDGFASARHYALERADENGCIAGHRIILAEKMTSLLQGDDFHDLLEFEEHIAALSACVLIFVESPGSIAELGSFSVMRHLAPRLLVVCEQKFEDKLNPSFIFLGPIASLRRRRTASVQVFPIFNNGERCELLPDKELLDDCWEYIEEAVLESLRRPIPEADLAREELSHQMILVATIIDLAVAIKVGELDECLEKFEIALSPKALRRILRMLEQFELISGKTYGNDHFYHSLVVQPLVTFRPKSTTMPTVFDSIRFKADAVSFYQEKDKRRAKAIKAFLKGMRQ